MAGVTTPTFGRQTDSRRGRPRDDGLTARLLGVAVELVAEQGWSTLTADAVAARAQAGKAGIYRRWTSVTDLMIEALFELVLIPPDEDTGSLRGDLTALLEPWTRPLSTAERAVGSLVGACHHDTDLAEAVHLAVVAPLTARLHQLAARHQTPRAQLVMLTVVVQALWWERYRTSAEPLTETDVQQLVDIVLLPLQRPPLPGA